MKAEEHMKAFDEHRAAINWAVDRGIDSSQRILGMHTSRGIVELLAAYLHKKKKIETGFQINHRWFKSSTAADRLPDFDKKDLITKMLVELENKSENLTYGSQKTENDIKGVVALFNTLEQLLNEMMKNDK